MSQVIERPVTREQHTVALSCLHPRPGFNPRSTRDREKFARLARSVQLKGVLQPLLVAPHPEIEGEYVIVDGEGRYLAAGDAQIVEVPIIVDVPDPDTDGLDDALIANMIRADLTPLEEARAFQRLLENGLSVKGVAQRLSRTPKFVKERLQLLALPEAMQRKLEKGEVPLTAVGALVQLAEMHPDLPAMAVEKVMNEPDRPHYSYHQSTWTDLVADPIGGVLAAGYTMALPSDVYVGGGEFALECFTLSEKAERDLTKLLEIAVPATREDIRVTFGRKLVAQAAALNAVHVGANGQVLIIGQDVADQLAGDGIAMMLKDAKAREQEALVQLRRQTAAQADGNAASDPETQRRTQAEQQREQDKKKRTKALAYNESLGAAVIQAFARVKLDVRVLKILSAIDFGGNLNDIAARGARYCLPFECWQRRRKLESGVVKIELIEAAHCTAPARQWLEGARGQAEYVGRLLALAVLARFADQHALPQSRRSHYTLHPASDLPWASEVIDLVDEIAGELLPAHLTDHILAPKRAKQQKAHEARALLEKALANPSALTEEESRPR
jgi:ParB/RepB/Spo0J family partition protein